MSGRKGVRRQSSRRNAPPEEEPGEEQNINLATMLLAHQMQKRQTKPSPSTGKKRKTEARSDDDADWESSDAEESSLQLKPHHTTFSKLTVPHLVNILIDLPDCEVLSTDSLQRLGGA